LPYFDSWNSWDDVHGIFPLLRRGWVYQERLLSPRVLHFTSHELYWECREGSYCECRHVNLTRQDVIGKYWYRSTTDAPNIRHAIPLEQSTPSSMSLTERWTEIIMEYSRLQLSFQYDRLPALSGIAKEMQKHRADQYLAGLWEDDLPAALLWYRKSVWLGDPRGSARPQEYTAPTWSWASITAIVSDDK
jgi:hypothetical protein